MSNRTSGRWAVEQVLAAAPRPTAITAAEPLAVPGRWSGLGCDERAVWGRCGGSSAEPYDTTVDHVAIRYRCSCPSRLSPCKHALALLLLWARGRVPTVQPSPAVADWLAKRPLTQPGQGSPAEGPSDDIDGAQHSAGNDGRQGDSVDRAEPVDAEAVPPERTTSRDERVARMAAGLAELDRWLDDRVRTGLADPALARYATWDGLAARLVDAQVGGLANRVRRLAGLVGARPNWHEQVLAELGVLHLLACGGRHLHELPPALADSVAVALGWQVRQANVLAGVPDTDHWMVMGRSDTREDRIEVRRVWLRGRENGRWAMVLSFAAYRQSLDASLAVGTTVHADVFRYPGAGLRVLVGPHHSDPVPSRPLVEAMVDATVAQAAAMIGSAFVVEPWVERVPVSFVAEPARAASGDGWVLTDATGSLPMAVVPGSGLTQLMACSGGAAVALTGEWTPAGVVPLTVHLADRNVDVGPVADASFADPGVLAS